MGGGKGPARALLGLLYTAFPNVQGVRELCLGELEDSADNSSYPFLSLDSWVSAFRQ